MCGKQRTSSVVFLEVWQIKELEAHFADLWQIKKLGESGADSKGITVVESGAWVEVWIAKELEELRIESKGVAGGFVPQSFEEFGDSLEVWQAKGLEDRENKLEDGALAGGTGRGTIPTDISPLLHFRHVSQGLSRETRSLEQ